MANRAKPVFSDTEGLRCPICLDEYTAPKNLPCLHTYCQHCLHKYIVKNVPKEKVGATFSCPECRKETFPPHPDISIDKWAEHYPNNTMLLSLLPPEKRKVDKSCDSCLYEGNSVSATSYCTVCKESHCATCESVHKKNKISRDHTVINIQDLFTDPELAVNVSVCVTCSEHVGKEFEFYCKSHRSMCCAECFYNSHRLCIEVLQLKDHSERILKEKEANSVVDRLKQLQSHLNKFKNENERSFKKTEAELNTISDEIEDIRKKINTLFDSVKNRINMEKNTLLKEESMIQHEENQQCESISSAITNSLHLLETVLAHGNPLHVLTTLHKTEEQLVHYESAVKEKYCEVRRIDAKLCLDDLLFSLIKCSETNIAMIVIVKKKHSLKPFLPLAIEKIVNTNVVKQNVPQAEKTVHEGKPQKNEWKPPKHEWKPSFWMSPKDDWKPPKNEGKPPKDEWKSPKDEWKHSFWMAPRDEWKPPKDEWKPPKDEWKLQQGVWKPPKDEWKLQQEEWKSQNDEWKPPTTKWTPPKEAAVSTPREPGPMGILLKMGFFNREQNRRLLQKHENNVQAVMQELLQSSDQSWMNKKH